MNPNMTQTTAPPVKANRKIFSIQFSIRSLLILTAVAAFVLTCIAVPPVFMIVSAVGFMLFSIATLVTLIFGRGWIRAFAVGAVLPILAGTIGFVGSGPPEGFIILAVALFGAVLSGLVAALVYSALAKRSFKISPPNLPLLRNWLRNP